MSRILVVEDDPKLRDLVRRLLIRGQHSVTEASDGLSAVNLCRSELPDLILTDLNMPGMDGYELIRRARIEWPAMPIIAMSGGLNDSSRQLESALALGASVTLPKPFTSGELDVAIAQAILSASGPSRDPFGAGVKSSGSGSNHILA